MIRVEARMDPNCSFNEKINNKNYQREDREPEQNKKLEIQGEKRLRNTE